MAPKRTAAKSPLRASKPAKKAKVAAASDPFTVALQSILDCLGESPSLTESECSMLCTSAEFALRPAKCDRHKFQTNMTNAIADALKNIDLAKKVTLEAEQSKLAQHESEKVANEFALTALGPQVETRQQTKKGCDAALKDAFTAHDDAKKAHAVALEVLGRLDVEHANIIAAKVAREKLISETWAQMKDGSLKGIKSRDRTKLMDTIVKVLTSLGVESSCTEALPHTLKEKQELRGFVGTKCIEYAEEHLQRSVKEMAHAIDGHANNTAEKEKTKDEAAMKLKQTESDIVLKQDEAIEAENSLMEATEQRAKLNRQLKDFDRDAKMIAAAIAEASAEYDQNLSGLAMFESLEEQGEAATAPAAAPQEEETAPAPLPHQDEEEEAAPAPAAQQEEEHVMS